MPFATRLRLMAKGLIIGDAYGALALNYYKRFPEEPVATNITIVVENLQLVADMSLDTLLQAIIDAWANKSFTGSDLVLVTHGNENGLTMRLFPGHKTDSRSDVLSTLMGSGSTQSIALALSITEAQATGLIAKMNQVRTLNIGWVEFRGCTIGQRQNNLKVLKDFLNATSVSGPDLLSTFANLPTVGVIKTGSMDIFVRTHLGTHLSGLPDGRFAFFRQPAGGHSDIVSANTESRLVTPEWLSKFMSNTSPGSTAGWMTVNLPVHYMRATPPIFPLEDAYLPHIQRVS
jgi:hypothetical protein